ncbi:MAG: hypothetical protein Q4F27_01825, partial [Desulfovibrionaceae bacterium]|nr:hypothetical protein [Desulfovibrionaceae bacterium]
VFLEPAGQAGIHGEAVGVGDFEMRGFGALIHDLAGLIAKVERLLPQVFQRHPVLNVAGVARAIAQKLGWPEESINWRLGTTEEISRKLHAIPFLLERV